MSLMDLQGKVAEAVAALEAGDYATASLKLDAADMILVGMPVDVMHGAERIRFSETRQRLDSLRKSLRARQRARGFGLGQIAIEFRK